MREAADLFETSALARTALGDAVVDHYVHYARTEMKAYESVVTEWERMRGFERL
jgi:glutamine synthetase